MGSTLSRKVAGASMVVLIAVLTVGLSGVRYAAQDCSAGKPFCYDTPIHLDSPINTPGFHQERGSAVPRRLDKSSAGPAGKQGGTGAARPEARPSPRPPREPPAYPSRSRVVGHLGIAKEGPRTPMCRRSRPDSSTSHRARPYMRTRSLTCYGDDDGRGGSRRAPNESPS